MLSQNTKVSVVIPLFNKELHIRRAVESVLNQSFQDFEIVVVDDGSTDGGAGIVRSMNNGKIRLIQQSNGGVSSARNRGIKEARNELIAFLDADDSYNPDFLAVIRDLASKYEEAGAFGTSFEIITEDMRRIAWRNRSLREAGTSEVLIRNYFRDVLSGPVIWSSAVAIRREAFDAAGLFPVGVRLGEDLDMWMRIAAKYRIAVSGYLGAVYHREATNRTDNGRIRGVEYALVKTGLGLLASSDLDGEQRRCLREYVSRYQITTAYHLLLLGQRDRARDMLLLCRTRKFVFNKLWWLFWTLIPTPVAVQAERIARRILTVRAELHPHDVPGVHAG